MKKIFFWTVAVVLTTGFLGGTAFAQTPFNKFRQQKQRIYQGKLQGQLTPKELKFLRKERQEIRRAYRMAMRDGRFSPMERRRIHKLLNKASRNIYRLKHNHRTSRLDYRNRGSWDRGTGFGRQHPVPGPKKSGHMSFAPYLRSW